MNTKNRNEIVFWFRSEWRMSGDLYWVSWNYALHFSFAARFFPWNSISPFLRFFLLFLCFAKDDANTMICIDLNRFFAIGETIDFHLLLTCGRFEWHLIDVLDKGNKPICFILFDSLGDNQPKNDLEIRFECSLRVHYLVDLSNRFRLHVSRVDVVVGRWDGNVDEGAHVQMDFDEHLLSTTNDVCVFESFHVFCRRRAQKSLNGISMASRQNVLENFRFHFLAKWKMHYCNLTFFGFCSFHSHFKPRSIDSQRPPRTFSLTSEIFARAREVKTHRDDILYLSIFMFIRSGRLETSVERKGREERQCDKVPWKNLKTVELKMLR